MYGVRMDDNSLFKAIAVLLAAASLVLLVLGVQVAFAVGVRVCEKDGGPAMTGLACPDIGTGMKATRPPESFLPLSGGNGLTAGERPLMAQYDLQRDEIPDR